jgi:tripartite-type tricarboxylate transporter receptor subunit TctC
MTIVRMLAATILLLLPAAAWAEDFPIKPIKLIVPFPPGGPNDIIARVVGQRMSEIAHQPVVIDNRSGQAGVLGTDAVAKSTPDGYTIGIVSSSALVYRGAAPAINDLLGQQVQMAFLDLPVILPHIKAGTLRGIALGAPTRASTAPDIPTTAEVGMPDILIENWYGMIAPAATPPAVVAALNKVATQAMADPSVKEKLADQGLTLEPQTPDEFRALIKAETRKWAKVIKDAGIETPK